MKDEYSLEKLKRVNEFKRIESKYKQRRYSEAKRELYHFTLRYPYDDYGWYLYSKILIQEGKYEDALNMLIDTNSGQNMMMQIDIIKCYLELYRFEEAYELICNIRGVVRNERSQLFLRRAEIVCLMALNDIKNLSFNDYNYVEKQMINYDREDALDYTKALDEKNPLFNRNVSIDKLFGEVECVLPQIVNLTNTATLTETHLLRIPAIGYSSGRKIDVLKAVTTYKGQDILSIYPATSIKDFPNHTISNQEKIKAKILK